MPTRSRRNERTPSRRCAVALGALVAALGGGAAWGHEPGADALPTEPGWRVGGALAGVLPGASDPWPVGAWPGVLGTGTAPRDQRGGLRLEHATADLAARVNRHFGAHLAIGWHDRDKAHVEAATVQAGMPWRDGEIGVALGRDTVRMGGVIDSAGHFDRFSQAPLAKRAVVNEQWIEDGLSVAWRRPDVDGLRAIEAGVWRGRAFPGGAAGPAAPSVHLHAGWGHVDAHFTVARLRPEGRGSAAQSLGASGHVHGALDCRASLLQRVCFDGTADVLGGSVQWEPAGTDWTLALAGLMRNERGSLYATNGAGTFHTRVQGMWADVAWRPAGRWTLAARAERLVATSRLEGTGTSALARDAGLVGARPVERVTGAVHFDVRDDLQLALEAGQERSGGGRVNHVALRAVWRNSRLLGGSW